MSVSLPKGVVFHSNAKLLPNPEAMSRVLTTEAIDFIASLQRTFNSRRLELLKKRVAKQKALDSGDSPAFLADTASIRSDTTWRVAPAPADLTKRWVEITGPTDKKMMINALNSGANVFMADFEDANSPTLKNLIEGQSNLIDAVAGTLSYTSSEGKQYRLNSPHAALMVRPRGWHLNEPRITIDSSPLSGSLFDFGLAFFHNAKTLIRSGTGPYYYLPKLESHLEARLWNDIFLFSQDALHIPRGTIRATVLIETILAAFEMEEILYELREHSGGLNAGRWDYIFSIIKKLGMRPDAVFPDRSQITMETPFMRAYAQLLVRTCHARGAFAIGGMSAFIPSRKDEEINAAALKKVASDKLREIKDGFDGTWVAHPDLVPVARDLFASALDGQPNQLDNMGATESVSGKQLLDFRIAGGKITESGLRQNIGIALQYLASWLSGVGAVAIANLMEDTATAEISRSQIWQWLHNPGALLEDGRPITQALYRKIAEEESMRLSSQYVDEKSKQSLKSARTILDRIVDREAFSDFLTDHSFDYLK